MTAPHPSPVQMTCDNTKRKAALLLILTSFPSTFTNCRTVHPTTTFRYTNEDKRWPLNFLFVHCHDSQSSCEFDSNWTHKEMGCEFSYLVYETRRFINVVTKVHHWILPRAISGQFTFSHTFLSNFHFNIIHLICILSLISESYFKHYRRDTGKGLWVLVQWGCGSWTGDTGGWGIPWAVSWGYECKAQEQTIASWPHARY
jgi:hypothetical protein